MELGAALERAEDDDDVRVVVIRGRGNTFCAGADLNMLDSEFLGTTNNSVKIAQVSARTFDRAFNLAKPTIAVVEGYAVAGGFELMISCDFCIVADDARSATSTSAARCSAAPGRSTACRATSACARPRSCSSPASCCRARSARTGAWRTCRRPPTSSTRRSPTSSRR